MAGEGSLTNLEEANNLVFTLRGYQVFKVCHIEDAIDDRSRGST
jgi:hypothetical protein